MSMATQPMPPSDMATLRSGWRTGQPDHSHSAQAVSDIWPNRVAPSWRAGHPSGKSAIPAEPGDHGEEVEPGPVPVDVRVADAGVDVPAAPAHLVEPEGLELDRFRPPARDRVHPHLAVEVAVELPDLVALLGLDYPGRSVLEPAWEPVLEHVGWLDQVVVHGDDGVADLPRLRVREEQVLGGGRHTHHSIRQGSRRASPGGPRRCSFLLHRPRGPEALPELW